MKTRRFSLGLATAVALGAAALATPTASAAEISTTLTVDGDMCTAINQFDEEDQQELTELAVESQREIADYLKEQLPAAAEAIDLLAEPVTDQTTDPETRDAARTEVNAAATAAGIPEPDRLVLLQLLEYGHLLAPQLTEDTGPRHLQRDDALVEQRDELLAWDGFLSQVTGSEDDADQLEFQPDTVTTVNQAFSWFQDLVDGEAELLTACIDGKPGTFTVNLGDNDEPFPAPAPSEDRTSLSSGSSFGSSR